MVALDVLIRQFISDPVIEYFADQSLRYNIVPKSELILGVVRHDLNLRRYCMRMQSEWLFLLSPLCEKCARPYTEHPREKCLFEASTWIEHLPDDENFLAVSP